MCKVWNVTILPNWPIARKWRSEAFLSLLRAYCTIIKTKNSFLVTWNVQIKYKSLLQYFTFLCLQIHVHYFPHFVSKSTTFFISKHFLYIVKALRSLQPPVEMQPLPSSVVKLFCNSTSRNSAIQDANLGSIDQILRDGLLPFQRDGVK